MEMFNPLPDAPAGTNEDVSFAEIFFHYLSYWKWFVVSVAVCMFVAFMYLRYTTAEYEVFSKVLIKDEKKGQTITDMNAAFRDLGLAPQISNFDNEVEILLSSTLMREIKDSLQLGVSYYAEGKIKRYEIYKSTPIFVSVSNQTGTGSFTITQEKNGLYLLSSPDFSRKFTLENESTLNSPWGILSFKENPFGVKQFPVEVVINNPRSIPRVQIAPINKTTSVVKVSTITPVPQKGMDIINTLIANYNRKVIDEKNYVATSTIRFIDSRLEIIAGDLATAEQKVEDFQRSVGGVADASTKAPIFLSEASNYNKRIADADIQLAILKETRNFLMQPENKTEMAPTNVGLTDPTVLTFIQKYNEEILSKNRNIVGLTANNPIVQEYDDRIAFLRDNLVKGINIAVSSMETTVRELTRQVKEFELKTVGLATQERESRDLYRQQSVKESLFTYLLQKREETNLSLALATPNASVIDPATYDLTPVKPKSKIIFLAAFLLGLIIPVVVVYIIDLFDNKLRHKEQLTKIVKAPFLGIIPKVKTDKVFPVLNVKSAVAEKFRIIASNLGFIVAGDQTKIIMVTSSYSGEGKSFFSQNLAMSLATTGKKTLLVDMDMRKSVLNKILNISVEKGLALFLSDPAVKVSEIIGKGVFHKQLDVIAIKVFPPNPAELIASNRLDTLFQYIKGKYEYIIIDTAPIGLVADAFRVNQFVDASIYVTRADYTYKSTLPEMQHLYTEHKLNNMTVVLNAVSAIKHYGYGYGYGYEHDKKNKYYTEEES